MEVEMKKPSFKAIIEKGRDDPLRQEDRTVFPGSPIMTLTEGNYYLVAILEPEFQVAVMKHLHWAGGPARTWWEPAIPEHLQVGPALIVPLVDLGEEWER
jgi:hypothetical protein